MLKRWASLCRTWSRRTAAVLGWLIAACCALPTLAAIGVSQQIQLDQFTTRDGLLHNTITDLFRQENGYLWIGTRGGLCRFNGRQFDDLSHMADVPAGVVTAIDGNERGPIWIATDTGLYSYLHDRFEQRLASDRNPIRQLMVDRQNRAWIDWDDEIRAVSLAGERVFTKGESLPEGSVTFFYEDGDGRIWAGIRQQGLVMLPPGSATWQLFDTRHGLPHINVNGLFETPVGLVAATHAGLAQFDGQAFTPVPFNDTLPSPIVYGGVVDDNGHWWMNFLGGGVLRWDGETAQVFTRDDGLVDNVIKEIFKDTAGQLWFLSARGLGLYTAGGFMRFTQDRGMTSNIVNCALADQGDMVWIGTGYGLNRYEPSRLDTYLVDPSANVPPIRSMARRIFTDRVGDLWFPSLKGLGYLENRDFRLFTTVDGLPADQIHTIFQDQSRRIWVGTPGGLALKVGGRFEEPTGPAAGNDVFLIDQDGLGRLWVLDRDGQVWLNENPDDAALGGFRAYRAFNGTTSMVAETNSGVLWVETLNSLHRIRDRVDTIDLKSSIPGGVLTRHLASDNSWWFGNFKGAYRYKDGSWQTFDRLGNGETLGVANIAEAPNGDLWFNTIDPESNLITGIAPRGLVRYANGQFNHFADAPGPLAQFKGWIRWDDYNRTWLFSNQGLSLWQAGTFTHYRVSDGLAGNKPTAMVVSSQREIWLGTNGGVNKIVEDKAFPKGLITSIANETELLDTEIDDLAVDRYGYLWIRTANGVQRYQPNKNLPRVELATWRHGQTTLPLESGRVLRPRQNNLYFRLSGIHLNRGADRMQFAYRLVGEDSAVAGVTRESELHFPNLNPGNYQLEVRAYNADLYTQDLPLSFSFTIVHPIWQRPWFILLALGLGLALYYLFYRIRLRQKLEKARVVNELQTARRMQLGLMPTSEPQLDDFEFYGMCVPAQEVGGDYYDYIWLDEERSHLGLTVMDVSGKSMEAAMISVLASGLVYSEINSNHTPGIIFSKINYPLYKKTDNKTFTTALLGDLSLHDRTLTLANAGHMDPIVIRNGQHLDMTPTTDRDLPLGVRSQWQYRERELILEPGDLVLFYTDGLSEASNEADELFGDQRIINFLERHHTVRISLLIHSLLKEIKAFAGSAPQADDITVIGFRVKAPSI